MGDFDWDSVAGFLAIIGIGWVGCGCLLTILTSFRRRGNSHIVYKNNNSTIIDKNITIIRDKNTKCFDENNDMII